MATEAKAVQAEILPDGDRVRVNFKYNPDRVIAIKDVPSAHFVSREKGGPYWRLNLDMATMMKLREKFGEDLNLGPKLREWGWNEKSKLTELQELSDANEAKLDNVPKRMVKGVKLKGMKGKFALRPYQTADIKFMSQANVIVANQPRTGKTITTISAIFEAEMEWGCHVVFAPLASLRTVWESEIKFAYKLAGYDEPTVLTGDNPSEIKAAITEAKERYDNGEAFWLITNPYYSRMKNVREGEGEDFKISQELISPELAEIHWDSITVDEFHLMGLSNPTTLGAKGVNYIAEATQPTRRYALSGTPMGGKPIKLWGALHFLNPEEFTSRWNWARHWLVINKSQYGSAIEGIMPGREADFYEHLKPYLVRRTQRDALPGLPPKVPLDVWADMTKNQLNQYISFARDAEWRIEDAENEGRLTASNVLAEYTRLKQFASAYCEVKKTGKTNSEGVEELVVIPTEDSGKLIQLFEKLEEVNVIGKGKDEDEDLACSVVFSQFVAFVDMISAALRKKGVPAAAMTGSTAAKWRTALTESYQLQKIEPLEKVSGKRPADIEELIKAGMPPRVLVMNTLVGGAALTLDRGETAHIMDETWVPDNQEQAENRITPTTKERMERPSIGVYYYRSKKSIEEYIQTLVADKQLNNKTVLDLRRRMQADLAEAEKAAA